MMRSALLWLARNQWLKARLPRLWFMRRAVRRFMPGETMDDALLAAEPLQAAGIGTLYTRLGENLTVLDEADEMLDLAQRAKSWPTVEETSTTYGLSVRLVRRLLADGEVRAFQLDRLPIDPDSLAAGLARRQP